MFTDTHTHIYLEEFDPDRGDVIRKAVESGVEKLLLPNIDSTSWEPLLSLCEAFPDHCFPMAGLHPSSVMEETVKSELHLVEQQLANRKYYAVGEIGIDLYWDKTFLAAQQAAFRQQLRWAKELKLPVAIHMRSSFQEVWDIVKEEAGPDLRGVFHCFSGNLEQALKVIGAGFFLGIGGVITFKNSGLQEVVREIGLDHVLLETDAPYLAPVPFRGQRNEPAYIPLIASKIAEITGASLNTVAEKTSTNAATLFNL